MLSLHGVFDNMGLTLTFSPARSFPKINCIPSKGNEFIISIRTSLETRSDCNLMLCRGIGLYSLECPPLINTFVPEYDCLENGNVFDWNRL